MEDGPVPTPRPERPGPDHDVDVLRYVWRIWRAAGPERGQLEDVTIHTLGLTEQDGQSVVRVEWSSEKETARPVHVLTHAIPLGGPLGPEDVGDEVVWKLWAAAHGTS